MRPTKLRRDRISMVDEHEVHRVRARNAHDSEGSQTFVAAPRVEELRRPISSVRLITAQRHIDDFNRTLRLNAELREHYDVLEQQRDALLRLQLQKERLTALLVHDLKNPVNCLELHAQFLQRHAALPADAQKSVSAMRKQAKHLTFLISNLLDISRAEAGRLVPKLEDVDLRLLVEEVLDDLAASAERRAIDLSSTIDVKHIPADFDLLQRVLTNLVVNAIHYSPSHGIVTVTAARDTGGTELRVTDVGRGIAAELRTKVFDAFEQLEATAAPGAVPGGHGLGLTFCKAAIEAHGGRIWVEDAAPGAAFCFRLPHSKLPSPAGS